MNNAWLDVLCSSHRWKWVSTWGLVGFEECQACGITRSVVERQVRIGDRIYQPEDLASEQLRPAVHAGPEMFRCHATEEARDTGTKRVRGTVEEARALARTVLAELAAGAKPKQIAAACGCSKSRVHKIRQAARARGEWPPREAIA